MRLAGTYHPIEYILLRMDEFFPSLENVGAIYLKSGELNYTINGDAQEIEVFDQVNIQKIRSKRSFTFDWTASPNLLDTPINSKQHSLYDEEKNTTLLIYLPSEKRDLCDVVILTFPKNQVMKATKDVFSGISTTDKSMIAVFALNVIKSEFHRVKAEQKTVVGFSHVQKNQLDKMEQLNLALDESKRLYLSSLRVLIYEYFEKLSNEFACSFIPSNDLIEKVGQLQMGIDDLYTHLRSAAELGYHLLLGEREIIIPSSYLILQSSTQQSNQVKSHDIVADKVFHLLDRYELASTELQSRNQAINGKNVAKQLDPPVTPPAISDAVKKNEKRIRFLLTQYSDKWPLIRKHLKPVERLNDASQTDIKRAI